MTGKFSGPENHSVIINRFPEASRWLVQRYLEQNKFRLRITRPCKQRLGSFRAATRDSLPVISLNNDLGEYTFLLVFLHELAHLHIWKLGKRRHAPHGKEWKYAYWLLVKPLIVENCLPVELSSKLGHYFSSKRSSFQQDTTFLKLLNQLEGNSPLLLLSDIPENTTFSLPQGKQLVKMGKLRTRYKCYCPANRKYYLVSAAAQVKIS